MIFKWEVFFKKMGLTMNETQRKLISRDFFFTFVLESYVIHSKQVTF